MNVPTQLAARDDYKTANGLPPYGSRVWISGFARHEHEEMARLLGLHGLRPSAFSSGADAVLVPGPPSDAVIADAEATGRRVLVADNLRANTPANRRHTAIEVHDDFVRILDVMLPRQPQGGRLVPPAKQFAHLCFDRLLLRAARTVAIAADNRLPCALEGETAVAKSTAVLWVAHLCRQNAVRLNLNGQSDAGELVGRFIPNVDDGTLDDKSHSNAPAPRAAWRFWEGIVPTAMRHGHWVVLDELNLAEPQVLERLNPVLESIPSLVLAEHRGERFGPGGDVPVDDGFRMFATMNPAEYAGRSVLSPAFRDRWSMWSHLEAPSEGEFRAMLDRLVHGTHPEFTLDNVLWQAPDSDPIHPCLADEPGIDDVLDAVASFHTAVAAASGNGHAPELGRTRRERYVFTRRTLLAAMQLAAGFVETGASVEPAIRRAIEHVYVERVQPGPDRQAILSALRTVGL
jgi:MoxR-like ATPase